MKHTMKHAVIAGFLGRTKDRFHEYNRSLSLDERLGMLTKIDGMDGAEVVYPYDIADADELRRLLQKHTVSLAAINVNVKGEPEFRDGSLTSGDPAVRKKALGFIREAKEFASVVGANKVTCCPLADGYEFSFHKDYGAAWDRLVGSLKEAAEAVPEMPLFVEYKPSETRGRCFADTCAKTLYLLEKVGKPNLGITLDFGHSAYGQENPAEAVSLLAGSGFPYYIHINDNDGKWDWDFMVGTHHYLAYVEFLYYLKKHGYADYVTSDTSPTRWDIVGTFEANVRMTNKIWDLLHRIETDRLDSLLAAGDFLETWKFVEENLFGLK